MQARIEWSLTRHLNAFCALQNAAPPIIQDWRHVVYACFQPKHMASEHDLELKRGAYENYEV